MGKTAPRMLQLVEFVRETVGKTGTVPSYADIGRALRMEYPGTVRRAVRRAVDAGHLMLSDDCRRKPGARGGTRIIVPGYIASASPANNIPERRKPLVRRLIPSGFCQVYVREGVSACSEIYGASEKTIKRWALECGKQAIQDRANVSTSNRRDNMHYRRGPRKPSRNYELMIDGSEL